MSALENNIHSSKRIPGLDTLRALAVMAVVLHHCGYCSWGGFGVMLFFCISGFLITGILLDAKEKYSLGSYLKNFYMRRVLRIFPLYYLYLIVLILVLITESATRFLHSDFLRWFFQTGLTREAFPWLITYLTNYALAFDWLKPDALYSHLWSLAVEEHFYMFFPLVVFFLNVRALIMVGIGLMVVCPLLRGMEASVSVFTFPNQSQTIFCLDFLAAGGLLAYIWRRKKILKKLEILIFIMMAVISCAVIAVTGVKSVIGVSLGYLAVNILCISIILFVLNMPEANFLRIRAIEYMGTISYGIYIWHMIIIYFWSKICYILSIDFIWLFPVYLILLFGISHFSHVYFEKRFMDLKVRYV